MITDNLSKAEIAKILNKPPRTIQYWTDACVVYPDIRGPVGRGVQRLYSYQNLLEFRMVEIMNTEFGLQLYAIRMLFDLLRKGKGPMKREDFFSDSMENKSLIAIFENAPKFNEDQYYWQRHEPISASLVLVEDGIVRLPTDRMARWALTVIDLTAVKKMAISSVE